MRLAWVMMAVLAVLQPACGASSRADRVARRSRPSQARDAAPGCVTAAVGERGEVDGRSYLLDAPAAPADRPLPLVLAFHGFLGDPGNLRAGVGFAGAAGNDLIVAYPAGHDGVRLLGTVGVGWDLRPDQTTDRDFVRRLLDHLEREPVRRSPAHLCHRHVERRVRREPARLSARRSVRRRRGGRGRAGPGRLPAVAAGADPVPLWLGRCGGAARVGASGRRLVGAPQRMRCRSTGRRLHQVGGVRSGGRGMCRTAASPLAGGRDAAHPGVLPSAREVLTVRQLDPPGLKLRSGLTVFSCVG